MPSASAAARPSERARGAQCGFVSPAPSTRRSSLVRPIGSGPRSAFMSTVTAKLEDASRYRELLIEQLTAPVRFTHAARELVGKGVTVFVEVGPGNVLSGL